MSNALRLEVEYWAAQEADLTEGDEACERKVFQCAAGQ